MSQTLKRGTLKGLTDIQRQMGRLYRESRANKIPDSKLTALSQHLKRLHDMMVQEREVDINEDLAQIEEQQLWN